MTGSAVALPGDRSGMAGAGAGADADADASPVPADVLGARICALASRLAVATYHWLAMIAEFDEREGWSGVGIKSCAHWLAWTCSLAPGTAREHVRVARALTALPLVSAEMAAGRLSYAKVREITRVSDQVDEAYLVELARTATASQLSRSVRGFRRAAGTRGRQEFSRDAIWFTADDGSVVISARLPAEEGAVVIAALEAARDELRKAEEVSAPADRAPVGCRPEEPSVTLPGRADALLQVAAGYLSAAPPDRSGEDRTTVVVHVNVEHLDARLGDAALPSGKEGSAEKRSRGNADAPRPVTLPAIPTDTCQVAGVGGIERETAQRLACDAILIGVARGRGGAVLNHGRRRRLVSEAQRRALQIRDGQCQFPSCQRISHLEAHHIIPWSHGGPTDTDNLILLCRFHHVACHEGGVRILVDRAGGPRKFVTPQGFPLSQGAPLTDSPGSTDSPDLDDYGGTPWRGDTWLLHHALDGSQGWKDPEAQNIRPLWAGEQFSLADTVSALFGRRSPRRERNGPAARDEAA